jgi:hypothetical protein
MHGVPSWHGVGSLVQLKGRFDSISYQRVLEKYMIPDAATPIGEDFAFQQGNASILGIV